MRESGRDVHLILIFGPEKNAGPFSKIGRTHANINRNVEGLAAYHAAEFRLGMPDLIVQPPQGSLRQYE